MKTHKFFWRIEHSYRDSGVKNKIYGYSPDDEFASKVSIDRNQRWGIANSGGIRKLSAGEKDKKNDKILPAAIFLISNQYTTSFHNPWDDTIDYETGTVKYWGDAKFRDGYEVDDWSGNILLSKINDLVLNGEYSLVPPILYFVKERAGYLVFKGLCVLQSLNKIWFLDKGNRVINYRPDLAILNIEKVDPEWLIIRAKSKGVDPRDNNVPLVWKRYVRTGTIERLLSWNNKIMTRQQQIPDPTGPGKLLLAQLLKLNPFEFERIICQLLECHQDIIHKIDRTRNVKDGGFDMEGEFILPAPFKYPIRFKGEVKRQKSPIGPKDVSRLVARLGRGEYGLFFTTSYFTKDAQKEVITDDYPVKLISGAGLYDFFYEAKLLDEKGVRFHLLKKPRT